MAGVDGAPSCGDRGRGQRLDAQGLESGADAHDVEDRVESTHLVEVDVIDGTPVGDSFRARERFEDLLGPRAHAVGKPSGAQRFSDVAPVAVGGLLGGVHTHADRADAVRGHASHGDARFGGEFVEQPLEVLGGEGAVRGAGIQQRAEELVARDAGRTVEVADELSPGRHAVSPVSVDASASAQAGRLIRVAITAAPKPLSMFTTPMPPAHELSIVSSAETPPKFAP